MTLAYPRLRRHRAAGSGGVGAVLLFALVSLVSVTALGAVLLRDASQSAERRVLLRGTSQARLVQSMAVAPSLLGADLDDLHTADFSQLRRVSQLAVAGGSLRFLKIRDDAGVVVFSVGEAPPQRSRDQTHGFAMAAEGGMAVRLVVDRGVTGGRLIVVDQPLLANNYGLSPGVLELGLPYGDIAAVTAVELRRTRIALAFGLGLLYLIQAALAWWTTRRLRSAATASEHRAMHDVLTALPNRRLFQHKAVEALANSRSSSTPPPTLVQVDLDDFKAVNDTLGHAAGDELLCVVARRLVAALRPGDVVARLGGDEFGLILEGAFTEATAIALLDRVGRELAREVIVMGIPLSVKASFGVALPGSGAVEMAVLLRRADVSMYQAKRAGNSVAVWRPGSDSDAVQLLGH